MKRCRAIIRLSATVLITAFTLPAMTQEGAALIRETIERSRQVTGLTYTMKKSERIKGEMEVGISDFKLLRNPFSVYLKQSVPNAGAEVLFVKGLNNGKAVVNPNGFPWVTLHLDPYGSELTKSQHHSLYEAGYDYVISVLEHIMNKYPADLNKIFILNGTVLWNEYSCYSITLDNHHFSYSAYSVGMGESVLFIAKRNMISEYMLMEKNPSLDDYNDVKAGQSILVPNDYARRMELYIDKITMLPVLVKVFDDVGLYEQYEYTNLKLNIEFTADEFTVDFKAYDF